MQLVNNILVPVDFSDESINALYYAAEFADALNARLSLLHVLESSEFKTSSYTNEVGKTKDNRIDAIYLKEHLKYLDNKLAKLANQPEIEPLVEGYEVVHDKMYLKVENIVKSKCTGMVVMGTRGKSAIDRVFAGSNTEKVIRNVTCPVMAIKGKNNFTTPKDIVFASDFDDDMPLITKWLKMFADHFGATVHLLFVNSPLFFKKHSDSRKKIESFIAKSGLENYTINIYSHTSKEEGIIEFATDINADMVTLMTYGRTGINRLFKHSVAESLSKKAPIPVLTFNKRMETDYPDQDKLKSEPEMQEQH